METIWIMLVAAALMLLIEKLWPANELPKVDKWWARVIVVNLVQAGIVLVAGRTIDVWFESGNESPWALAQHVGLGWQVAIGYVSITFVYYWWHRVRHESAFFWKLCHQIHHSPRRMEILMSFYKHPVEITLNAIISSSLLLNYFTTGRLVRHVGWVCFSNVLSHTGYIIKRIITRIITLIYHYGTCCLGRMRTHMKMLVSVVSLRQMRTDWMIC